MKESYNVVNEKWINVSVKGKLVQMSLFDLFTDLNRIEKIHCTAVECLAVLRLLMAITYSALQGPKTEADWLACRDLISTKILPYLKKHEKEFDLFGEYPFLQVGDLSDIKGDKNKLYGRTIDTLDMLDNNHFYNTSVPQELSVITIKLLTHLIFGHAGKNAAHELISDTSGKDAMMSDLLLTYCEGKTLLDTLWYNLVPLSDLGSNGAPIILDKPIWEQHIKYKDIKSKILSKATHQIATGYLFNLVPLTRCIKLGTINGQYRLIYTEGLHICGDKSIYRDPMTTLYNKPSTGEIGAPIKMNPRRAPWFNLESILNVQHQQTNKHIGALTISNIERLPNKKTKVRITVTGAKWNNASIIENNTKWCYIIRPESLSLTKHTEYRIGAEFASDCSKILFGKVSQLFKKGNNGSKNVASIASKQAANTSYTFWETINAKFIQSFMDNINESTTQEELTKVQEEWRKGILSLTRKMFDSLYGKYNFPMKEFVTTQSVLNYDLNKLAAKTGVSKSSN